MNETKEINQHHTHLWLRIAVVACFIVTVVVMLLIYIKDGEDFKVLSLEGYLGAIATMIAICTAIMLGAQIYSIYHKSQEEKEYRRELESIKSWFSATSAKHEEELRNLVKTSKSIYMVKYHVNDALAGLHYAESKYLEGIIDVMENIYIVIAVPEVFPTEFEYTSKLGYACYSIAKNLKRYKDDAMIRDIQRESLLRIKDRWNKRFSQIESTNQRVRFIYNDLCFLNKLLNNMVDCVVNSNNHYALSEKDNTALCRLAKD